MINAQNLLPLGDGVGGIPNPISISAAAITYEGATVSSVRFDSINQALNEYESAARGQWRRLYMHLSYVISTLIKNNEIVLLNNHCNIWANGDFDPASGHVYAGVQRAERGVPPVLIFSEENPRGVNRVQISNKIADKIKFPKNRHLNPLQTLNHNMVKSAEFKVRRAKKTKVGRQIRKKSSLRRPGSFVTNLNKRLMFEKRRENYWTYQQSLKTYEGLSREEILQKKLEEIDRDRGKHNNLVANMNRPMDLIGFVMPHQTGNRGTTPAPGCGMELPNGYEHGHIMALELGGPDDHFNLVPQTMYFNQYGPWRTREVMVRRRAEALTTLTDPGMGISRLTMSFLLIHVSLRYDNMVYGSLEWATPSSYFWTTYHVEVTMMNNGGLGGTYNIWEVDNLTSKIDCGWEDDEMVAAHNSLHDGNRIILRD